MPDITFKRLQCAIDESGEQPRMRVLPGSVVRLEERLYIPEGVLPTEDLGTLYQCPGILGTSPVEMALLGDLKICLGVDPVVYEVGWVYYMNGRLPNGTPLVLELTLVP